MIASHPVNRPPEIQYRINELCLKSCRQHPSWHSKATADAQLAQFCSGASARDVHAWMISQGFTASTSSLSRHKAKHLTRIDVAAEQADAAAEAALPKLGALEVLAKLLDLGARALTPTTRVSPDLLVKIVALQAQLTGNRSMDAWYEAVNTAFNEEDAFDGPHALTEAVEAVMDETTEENQS